MKGRWLLLYCFLCVLYILRYAQAPLEFIENKGQWGSWFKYKVTTMGGDVCLEKDGFRYILCDPQNVRKIDSFHTGQIQNPIMRFHVYKVTFEGASDIPDIEGEKPQKELLQLFILAMTRIPMEIRHTPLPRA